MARWLEIATVYCASRRKTNVAERANLVVELTLGAHLEEEDSSGGHAHSLDERAWPDENNSQHNSSPACPFEQRLLPAQQRHEICFWFDLSQNFSPTTTTTESSQLAANSNQTFEFRSRGLRDFAQPEVGQQHKRARRERLIEAELHVFKLYPTRRNLHNLMENNSSSSNQTASVYHLKTNLLEVSLYQILPRRKTTTTTTTTTTTNTNNNGGEFPLRLLDIRRIDLNANGWETFYVKRAVADWLRDARVNLGLVIKAKSMFDEPLQVGQIIFADAYDHHHNHRENTATPRRSSNLTASTQNFDISHQPLLVIYTQQEEQLDT